MDDFGVPLFLETPISGKCVGKILQKKNVSQVINDGNASTKKKDHVNI